MKSNAKSKAKRDAERLLGIPPSYKPLTSEKKAKKALYQRERRANLYGETHKRIPMTTEEKRLAKIISARKTYEKNLYKAGKSRQIPIRQRNQEKPEKMEKILKARPARRISERVVKPVKIDAKQQTSCKILADDTGKVKVRLNARTEVMAMPGYDIEALRRKYGIS